MPAITDSKRREDVAGIDYRLHLLSKELEEAANEFLAKIDQLEKLLPEVNE
jgi:hypothetical protein